MRRREHGGGGRGVQGVLGLARERKRESKYLVCIEYKKKPGGLRRTAVCFVLLSFFCIS